jgi:hypothetical protein
LYANDVSERTPDRRSGKDFDRFQTDQHRGPSLARRWRSAGVLRPLDDQGIADLIQAIWVIAETWLAVGELSGTSVESADGERLLRLVLDPYLLPG